MQIIVNKSDGYNKSFKLQTVVATVKFFRKCKVGYYCIR